MIIAKGTKAAQELSERAVRVIGLQDRQTDLKTETKKLTEQIADEFADAASAGFNAKAMRVAVQRMRMTDDERQAAFDFEQEVDLYCGALGVLAPSAQSAFNAEQIFDAMTDGERDEASLRICAGEDATTAVTKAVSKRAGNAKTPEAVS